MKKNISITSCCIFFSSYQIVCMIALVPVGKLLNDMIEKATGEKLTAKYYAKQFVN